jgi:riboflavin synthase
MFTGLVESFGHITTRAQRGAVVQVLITAPDLAARLRTGDSISVNGVCLTALDIDTKNTPPCFTADLAAETIARTTLGNLALGTRVNLELPTPAGTPLGGHIVQGHVDGVGTLIELNAVGREAETSDWRLEIELPPTLMRYVVEKGSISIDGISLTVAAVTGNRITIAILPHTYKVTNLHTLTPGSAVNIEVDALARYAEQLRSAEKENSITLAELVRRGF